MINNSVHVSNVTGNLFYSVQKDVVSIMSSYHALGLCSNDSVGSAQVSHIPSSLPRLQGGQ